MGEWDILQVQFRAGSISRRQFLERAAVLGISALGISTALSTTALGQTPRRGGHLIVGLGGATTGDSLDPERLWPRYMSILELSIHDTLVEFDEQVRLQPSLAESWDATGAGTEWIIKLRKGVTFHNGKELTAADVVYSLNHHRGKDSKSPAKVLLAPLTDIKASGKYEVTLVLESAYVDLPYILEGSQLVILPEGVSFTAGVGAGAFVLESFEPGVRARIKRNPNYWRSDRGFLDSVEVLVINDRTARTSALLSGAIHLMNLIDPRDAPQFAKRPEIQIFNVPGGGYPAFIMRCDTAPFDNNDLRLAMKYAISREAIVKTLLRGYGKVGNDNPIPSYDPFFAAGIPQRSYDPEKAKFYFKKSGYSGPIVLSVAENAVFAGAVDAALLYQASAVKAGITIQVDRVPDDGYWDNVWRKKPFCTTWWAGRATADLMLSVGYHSGSPWNETLWKRPKFDQLLLAARKELNTAKRKQMYGDLQLMIHDDGGAIIMLFNNFVDGGLKRVRGFPLNPTHEMGGFRALKHIWLEA
jgi:peptide/nickel transport system substrate-binding protein